MQRLLLFLLFVSNACLASQPQTNVVVYGDDAYPPYSYLENGEIKGIYTDILTAVFERMPQYRVKITLLPWRRGLKMLKFGEGFALFPPYYYSDKRHYISPYSLPILNEEVVTYCHPDSVADRELNQWPNGYQGLTFGINEAYALGGAKFWNAVRHRKITIIEAKGTQENIINLYKNRIDCYLNDRISTLWELKMLAKRGEIDASWKPILGTSVEDQNGYLGFTNVAPERYPYKDHFIEQFNQTLNALKNDGTVDTIVSPYLEKY